MERTNIYKFLIILVLILGGVFIPTKDSFASNSIIIGFIIEADQIEGTLEDPVIITEDTAVEKARPMLELKFENLSAKGLRIKKLVQSPKGIVTFDMNPKETVLFNNLTLHVTNTVFVDHYLPSSGNIGFKKIKLLAHRVTANNSNLPQFQLRFNEGGEVELEPKSEDELIQMKTNLKYLLSRQQQ